MVAIIPFSILEFQAECNFIVFSLNVKRNWQTKRASQYLSPEEGEGWTIFFLGGGGEEVEAQSSPTQYRGALISIEIDRQLITSEEDHENIKKPYEGSGNCVREKTKIQTKTL